MYVTWSSEINIGCHHHYNLANEKMIIHQKDKRDSNQPVYCWSPDKVLNNVWF